MGERRTPRKLAAILVADMVGFSRLMEADETDTIARMKSHRKNLIDANIGGYGGRLVKTMGDGFLAEFASAVDAVECAVAIQRGVAAQEHDVPDHRRIRYRIGINVGDIVVDGDDIYGDGVNIAARLEALCEADGIYVSEAVREQVHGKIDCALEDLGTTGVKNLSRPLRIHRVVLESIAGAGPVAHDLTDKPSVAVLSFDNTGGDPDHAYIANGLADEIITTLSKISGLVVIARNSTFAFRDQATDVRLVARKLGVRYVLEGSVRGHGDRLRINAQLIEASSGNHLWGERYDRVTDDIFDLEDEITRQIVTALRVELTDGENAEVWNRGTDNIEAWRFATEAVEALLKYSAKGNADARDLADRARRADPGYALAWAILGISHWYEVRLAPTEGSDKAMAEAQDCAERAYELDPTNPWTVGLRTYVLLSQKRFDEAVQTARSGVLSNPGGADSRAYLGFALMSAGQSVEAIRCYRQAMALNPLYPIWYLPTVARALDAAGRQDEALQAVTAALGRDPDNFPSRLTATSLFARLGRENEAREALSQVLRLVPYFDLARARDWLVSQDEAYVANYLEGLRQAGLD